MGNDAVYDINISGGTFITTTMVSLIHFLLEKIPNDGIQSLKMHGCWPSYSESLSFMLNELSKKIAKPKLTSLTIGGFDATK